MGNADRGVWKRYSPGDVVGEITLLEYVGKRRWVVEYKCGHKGESTSGNVLNSRTGLCGQCARKIPSKVVHGMTSTKEHGIWMGMKQRCYDKNCKDFSSYGGKGVEVAAEWVDCFVSFFEYMGECPDGMTIDRVDSNGNYEPGNVRWVTYSTQNHNRGAMKNNKTGKKGVHKLSVGDGWQAGIMVDGKKFHLGTFKTFEEAKSAREQAELLHLGKIKDC